jgi:hypothetical protein
MSIYDQIPILLGYNNNVTIQYELEEWLEPNGINIILDKDRYHRHYISEKKLTEIIQLNRELSLNFDDNINDRFKLEWKVGDMCYFEFKVHYITEMIDDRITGCSDGIGVTSSFSLNDRCFKINPHTLRCSNNVEFYYRWINEKWDNMGEPGYLVNFPVFIIY